MKSISKEEEILNKRLEELEKKYKGKLFEADIKKRTEEEIKKDIQKEIEEKKRIEREEKLRRERAEREIEKEKTAEKPKISEAKKPKLKLPDVELKIPEAKFLEPKIFKAKPDIKESRLYEGFENFEADRRENTPEVIEIKSEIKSSGAAKLNEDEIIKFAGRIKELRREIAKIIVGQEKIINDLIMGLLCDAHVLVEGVPGVAKTLAIRALASASGCSVKRVQFTVDLLPTDIIGITSYTPGKGFEVIKGPVFANFIIADEINRSTPKTQSALIEAMQEKQVTIGRKTYPLPEPFFVMATENPLENVGVYPLPEAQIDRFLFKLIMDYPKENEERKILETNITLQKFEDFQLKAIVSPAEILRMQELVKKVYLDESIKSYILAIVRKTREKNFSNADYILYGSSPRASIGLFIASKANALINGRNYVLPEDVKQISFNVLRHRLILSYKAIVQKISPDSIIKDLLDSIRVV